ncbi:MAG: hypothetical protein HDS20_04930 [Bacteroides sp.]|nr:hypothetical protein [Bacteroides sp.]MBD5353198.1 hypothetical protein [Bacteroides sp.]MBD5362561.1 hypothetical protein [Bacteroides sp.]
MPTKLLLALSMLLLAACSGGKKFSVKIDSESLGTQKLTVVYTQPDGHRVLIEPTAVNGEVQFSGSATEPSTVEVFTSSGAKLVSFKALNGEKISITFSPDGPIISGAGTTLTDTLTAEPDTAKFIAPAIIVGRDTSECWDAKGIWVFTSSANERTKEVMDTIRAHKKQVRDVFISSAMDTWREATRYDSATWKQGILPEGPVAIPQLSATPMLLEVDSAGQIIRRQAL